MTPAAALALALGLFAALVPVTIAGANIAWGILLAALLWAWAAGRRPDLSAPRTALEAPLWAYCAVALLSGLLAVHPHESLRHFNQDAHKLWLALLLAVALRAAPGRGPLRWLAAGFAAAALLGCAQWGAHVLQLPGLGRFPSARAHAFVAPVTFGEQMAVALLGAAAFMLRPAAGVPRRAAAALAALFTAALLLSDTRGAVLGAGCGLAVMLLVIPGRRRLALAGAVGTLALLAALDLAVPQRSFLRQALRSERVGVASGGQMVRLTLWEEGLRMGLDHPWLGVGPNNYRDVLPRYVTMRFEDGSNSWGTAHDLYVHHFAERGLIGLAVTLWLLGVLLVGAWRRARRSPDPWQVWALGVAAAFPVMNLTEVALQVEMVWMLVWLVWLWAEARERAGAGADALPSSAQVG
ncbi:MAG: O-antigen ligase family protein [Elusimicrobia bacterium]|nr:O-antigen ligase family protein [Elusimicrobiota bacterium]